MKYLHADTYIGDADCSNDAVKPTEMLESKLAELRAQLSDDVARSSEENAKLWLDSAYILIDLDRKEEAWSAGHEGLKLALASDSWQQAVEACDVIYQAEADDAVSALGQGIWLGVTFPIDPELSVAMLQHFVEETPPDSDGAALAAATASYIVQLRAEGKQREELQFFTAQMLGQVARRHTNGAADTQELFDIWAERLELFDASKTLPRLSQVIDVIVGDNWWFDRDELRSRIPAE